MNTIKLTPKMLKFMKLQRTGIKRSDEPEKAFVENIEADFEIIKPYLPPKAANIFDIGAGLGAINPYVNEAYTLNGCKVSFYLLDYDRKDWLVRYGYKNNPSAYNSFKLAEELLTSNGIQAGLIKFLDAAKNQFPKGKFDVVYSFLSWGFHYPVDLYLERVKNVITPATVVILDVRKNTDQIDILEENFRSVKTVRQFSKHVKVVCNGAKGV